MQSLAYIPASNGTGNASLMTVQTVRSPGASDIIVNTVTGAPDKFYASMGAPHTFTDPVTGETITVISEATAVDFAGHLDSGKVVIDAIAPGYDDDRGSLVGDIIVIRPVTEWANNLFNILSVAHNDDGTIKNDAITTKDQFVDALDPVLRASEANNGRSWISNGGVWTLTSGLTAAMTAGVAYIGGVRVPFSAIASKVFTATKDTWVSVNNAGAIAYNEVTVAATPTLPANSVWLARIRSNGSTLTYIDQGFNPETSFGGFDPDFNPVYPRFGDRVVARHTTTVGASTGISGSQVAWNGLTGMQVKTVKGRRYRLIMHEGIIDGFGAGTNGGFIQLYFHHDPTTTRANQVGVTRHSMTTGGSGMDGTVEFIGRQEGLSWINVGAAMSNLSGTIQITRGVGYPCHYTLEEI